MSKCVQNLARKDDGQKVITIAHPEHSSGKLKMSCNGCFHIGPVTGPRPVILARARDKGSIQVKYPYVLSKYSIIFKNLGIDTQLI